MKSLFQGGTAPPAGSFWGPPAGSPSQSCCPSRRAVRAQGSEGRAPVQDAVPALPEHAPAPRYGVFAHPDERIKRIFQMPEPPAFKLLFGCVPVLGDKKSEVAHRIAPVRSQKRLRLKPGARQRKGQQRRAGKGAFERDDLRRKEGDSCAGPDETGVCLEFFDDGRALAAGAPERDAYGFDLCA